MNRSINIIRVARTYVKKTRNGTYKVILDEPFGTGNNLFTRHITYGFKTESEAEKHIVKKQVSAMQVSPV